MSHTTNNLGLQVKSAGVLSLLQDSGRYGAFNLGLTNGGPADATAFYWANRLCDNDVNATCIEVSLGGLVLIAQLDCMIAVTGAPMPLSINGKPQQLWESFKVKSGDTISLGFASVGVRTYLAIAGGFDIKDSFGSTATVCRESIGGINGSKLIEGDVLPCLLSDSDERHAPSIKQRKCLMLPVDCQPTYENDVILRAILSYQQDSFSALEKRLFFSSNYKVSQHWDRMGYRLNGRAIKSDITGILSEGICYGAIQVPADGQPIVLLNDRQTIGGYPKIGAVISQDCAKLAQCREGDTVAFEQVSLSEADNLFHLHASKLKRTKLIT